MLEVNILQKQTHRKRDQVCITSGTEGELDGGQKVQTCNYKVSNTRDVMHNMRNIINTQWCSVASVIANSATLWDTARQAPLSMGFSRQE